LAKRLPGLAQPSPRVVLLLLATTALVMLSAGAPAIADLTGGLAAVRTKTLWFHDDLPVTRRVEFSDWRWGWVAGFGTEWAWSPNVSIKSEVLYVGVADRDYQTQFFTPPAAPSAFRHSDSLWVSRIGLNVTFGGPVAARY
jgi:hypothetical protein